MIVLSDECNLDTYLQDDIERRTIRKLIHCYHRKWLVDQEKLTGNDIVLLSIYMSCNYNKVGEIEYEKALELSKKLGLQSIYFSIYTSRIKKRGLIEEIVKQNRKYLALKFKGLRWIKKLLGKPLDEYLIISKGMFYTAKMKFETILENAKDEEILVCDPYISDKTLHPFTVLADKNIKYIKLLTSNVSNSDKLVSYVKDFEKEFNIKIEIRNVKGIHDRYVIFDTEAWFLGSSIKDLGNKDTILAKVSPLLNSLRELFFRRWEEAESIYS